VAALGAAAAGAPPLFTVGHSTHPADEFLALLRAHGVERLVDVRRFPGSRRHPQFAREALAESLRAAGIAYRHDARLGGRRHALPGSPNTAWRNEQFRGYADHMATAEFQAALQALLDEAAARRTTVMCAEAVPWRCHRQLLADAALLAGRPVLHILSAADARPHELNPSARVDALGRLTYPAEAQLGLPGLGTEG